MQSSSPDDCVSHYNIEILNLFDPELQLSNTKSIIKNKLKVLFFELKKYEVETILILQCKKIDDHELMCKIFHLSAKLIVNIQTF